MGGNPPLGYDASERTLVINLAEAKTVRHLFALYLQLGCVRRVKDEADRLGLRTKLSTTANGAERGGKPFSRGHIYRLLSNRFTPVRSRTRVSSTPASIRRSSNMRFGPLFAARHKPGIKNGFFSGVEVKISLFSPRRQGIRRGSR